MRFQDALDDARDDVLDEPPDDVPEDELGDLGGVFSSVLLALTRWRSNHYPVAIELLPQS